VRWLSVSSGADGRYMYILAKTLYLMNKLRSRYLLCLLIRLRMTKWYNDSPVNHPN
jgi:hypothetical protein